MDVGDDEGLREEDNIGLSSCCCCCGLLLTIKDVGAKEGDSFEENVAASTKNKVGENNTTSNVHVRSLAGKNEWRTSVDFTSHIIRGRWRWRWYLIIKE